MTSVLSAEASIAEYAPPAPTPRYIPPDAKPTLRGYLRYFQIMARNPLEIFTKRNFDDFIQTSQVFGQKYALVHDPEAIRRFLVSNAENYRLTRLRRLLFEPLIGNGLLIAEGESWRRTRRALTPVFNHRRVRGFAPIMKSVVEEEAEGLGAQNGEAVSAADKMLGLALNVLTACLFSGDTAIDTVRFSRNLDRLLELAGMPHPLDLAGAPDWAPRLGRGEARRVVAELRNQVDDVVAARRARSSEADEQDFLSLLMNAGSEEGAPLTDKEIVDNLITFLAAGHETTARSLTWTLYLLSQSKNAYALAVEEVDAADLDAIDPADWMQALPWTTAVLKESMRLYPAAAIFSRQAIGPDRLGDVDIPAGMEIVTSPWVLHRHNRLWENPNIFDPSRFLGERGEAIARYAYMPFGAGPRICIGASFSMQEMVIALGVFLKRLLFEDAGECAPDPVMRITIHPSTDVNMRFRMR
ncbi:MAG: cytochrome P450 [Pseudomonadota bacterium]